ncbi:hypothetical protein [Virgibacillus sediminis]|uniref:Imidazoleglycerol-phosphate dehydratase n=1 Tax=Virgibacillus sediminis TaxID=202260 RepID=A0ABV7A7H9_9BACI
MAEEKKGPNRQFKENENHGEHRNGRKSPYKNSSTHGDEEIDQYISKKDQ